ncbi:unnamed protein product, partial [Effrenium voratum]
DNEEKRQYFHPTVPGRRALQEEGFQPEQIKADVNVLGYCLQGVSARKALAMQAKRLEAAVATAMRIRCLPGGLNRQIRLARLTVPTKGGFGWLFRSPSKDDLKPLMRAQRLLMQKPKSPPLYWILRGHWWDLQYEAAQHMVDILLCRAARDPHAAMPDAMRGMLPKSDLDGPPSVRGRETRDQEIL